MSKRKTMRGVIDQNFVVRSQMHYRPNRNNVAKEIKLRGLFMMLDT